MTVVKTCVLGLAGIVNFHRKLGGNAWYQMTSCSVYKLRELPRGGTRYSGAVWASVFWVVSNCIVYALLCIFFYYCCCFSSSFAVLLNHFYPNSWVLHFFFFSWSSSPPSRWGGVSEQLCGTWLLDVAEPQHPASEQRCLFQNFI